MNRRKIRSPLSSHAISSSTLLSHFGAVFALSAIEKQNNLDVPRHRYFFLTLELCSSYLHSVSECHHAASSLIYVTNTSLQTAWNESQLSDTAHKLNEMRMYTLTAINLAAASYG